MLSNALLNFFPTKGHFSGATRTVGKGFLGREVCMKVFTFFSVLYTLTSQSCGGLRMDCPSPDGLIRRVTSTLPANTPFIFTPTDPKPIVPTTSFIQVSHWSPCPKSRSQGHVLDNRRPPLPPRVHRHYFNRAVLSLLPLAYSASSTPSPGNHLKGSGPWSPPGNDEQSSFQG